MKNLAAIVTTRALNEALEEAYKHRPQLNPSTKFHIVYRNEGFPPKEIVRMAARKMGIKQLDSYRLIGGESTNRHLRNKGFKIEQFAEWEISQKLNNGARVGAAKNEQKITRITYNTNGWVSPSGPKGKSRTAGLHESDFGFGYEEWLFNFSSKINGFKYAFIEGFRTPNNKHAGQVYDLQLFTIDNVEKEKYWVATIKNCQVLTDDEKEKALHSFAKKGYLKEMEDDLREGDLWNTRVARIMGLTPPNVRFKEEDVIIYDTPIPVTHNSYIDSRDRYLLYDWNEAVNIDLQTKTSFVFRASKPNADKKVQRQKESNFRSTEIRQLHRKIAAALYERLVEEVGQSNVGCDVQNSDGTYIDMVKRVGQRYVFYEIKTYPQLRKNIREALGQLLEYAYYSSEKAKSIQALVIVSESDLDKTNEEYLYRLKNKFGIPVGYLKQEIS